MTEFFSFADLTWPEVAALPRQTPLALPLGEGYPEEALARALGGAPRAGWLPAFPFGWPGSGLQVPDRLLLACLANLLAGLREDGFTRLYLLTPAGLDWPASPGEASLPAERLALPRLESAAAPPAEAPPAGSPPPPESRGWLPPDAERGKVVIAPIGHTEQHGHHLPLCTDTLIVDAIARGVVSAAPGRAARLPVMPYGVSTHRSAFAGTFNIGGRAFEDFWLAVVESLAARRFDRLYLISGHGGNCSFLVNVVKYAGERFPRFFSTTAWLYLSGPQGAAELQRLRRSPLGGMGHAGELETSLILHLRPDLARMPRVVDETDFVATPSYFMDWLEGGPLVANPPWDDDTATGAYGAGSLATAEHGKAWLQAAIEEKLAHVEEIHEQHERREARRRSGFGRWGSRRVRDPE